MDKEPTIERDPKREKIVKMMDRLHWLKDAWKSEKSAEILSGVSKDKMYKVRKNWWGGLFSDLEYGVLPLLDSEKHAALIEEINNFFSQFGCDEFRDRLTTKKDIDTAEALINKVVLELKNLQNSI
jgi:hypothetical protein